jgi:hypothetical protein
MCEAFLTVRLSSAFPPTLSLAVVMTVPLTHPISRVLDRPKSWLRGAVVVIDL